MKLATLSRRARAVLRAFLALWIKPKPALIPRASSEIEAARARYRDAQIRRDTRALHSASQLLRFAMLNELRREVAARKGIGS